MTGDAARSLSDRAAEAPADPPVGSDPLGGLQGDAGQADGPVIDRVPTGAPVDGEEVVGPKRDAAPDAPRHDGPRLTAEALWTPLFARLFDAPHFRRGLEARGVDAAELERSGPHALLIDRGEELRVSPTPFFDEAYYLDRHPDVAEAGLWGFAHFLMAGIHEGRSPHPLVDPAFIAADLDVPSGEAIAIWLERESSPHPLFWHGFMRWNDAATIEQQRAIYRGLARHCPDPGLAERVLTYLPLLVHPALADGARPWAIVAHVLNEGAAEALPSPYLRASVAGGDGTASLLDRLPADPDRRWSPTPWLDMAFYGTRNPDLAPWPHELLLHFLRHGQFEGRIAHPMFDGCWYRAHHGLPVSESLHVHFAAAAAGGRVVRPNASAMSPVEIADLSGMDVWDAIGVLAGEYASLFAITSPAAGTGDAAERAVAGQIAAAARLDPAIRTERPDRLLLPKPFDVGHAAPLERMRRRLAGCDVLIARDHVTIGGADRVAGEMAVALVGAGHRVGVIATARTPDHEAGLTRYPDVPVLVLEDLTGGADAAQAGELLYEAVTLPGVRAALAVNSAAALAVFEWFGRQITERTRLFVTYFCDDRDEHGNPDGYPARSFLALAGLLSGVFADTHALARELRERVAPSEALAAKVLALPTPYVRPGHAKPVDPAVPDPVVPATIVEDASARPRVAWAGRFDRQKRADLLPPLAALMPDVELHVWGKAVLDRSPFEGAVPEGLTLHGTFASFDEVLAVGPAAFLYTSAWDGAPTILFDAVAAGLPVVASDVGGVRECLPPDYPFLVPPERGPEAYVEALHALLETLERDGHEAVTRGYDDVLRARAPEAFAAALTGALRAAGVVPASPSGATQ